MFSYAAKIWSNLLRSKRYPTTKATLVPTTDRDLGAPKAMFCIRHVASCLAQSEVFFLFFLFFFFKQFYLFIHEIHREKGRDTGRLCVGSPMWDSIPGLWNSPELKADTQPLSHPRIPLVPLPNATLSFPTSVSPETAKPAPQPTAIPTGSSPGSRATSSVKPPLLTSSSPL